MATFLTLQQQLVQQTRLNLGQATELSLCKAWLNDTMQDIHNRSDWYWAKDRAVVQTVIDKTAGTIAVAVGGTTITGTSTAFAAADVGKFIQTSDSDDWYKITSVDASAQTLVIEAPYTGTTELTVGTYTIRKWFYSLPSTAEKPLNIRQARSPRVITPVRFRDFDRNNPNSSTTGKGETYMLWGVDSSGYIQFLIWPWADVVYNMECRFKKKFVALSGDTEEPSIPAQWQYVIMEGALIKGYRHITTDPQDTRALTQNKIYEAKIELMKEKNELDDSDYIPVIQSRETPRMAMSSLPRLPDDFDIRG